MHLRHHADLGRLLRNKRLVFCGLGNAFHAILRDLEGIPYQMAALLDNDPAKQGSVFRGLVIEPPAAIRKVAFDYLILSTPFYGDLVRQLAALGVEERRLVRLGASYSFGCSIFETHAAQKALQNTGFTLISNDCWGGIVYSWLGLPFASPFINLIVPPRDFLRLMEDSIYFLRQALTFRPGDQKGAYPVASLDSVKIHFVHDTDAGKAKAGWNRRLPRINPANLFYKFECDGADLLQIFDRLPAPHKIAFTRNPQAKGNSVVLLEDEAGDGPQLQRTCLACRRQVDLVRWLNTGVIAPPSP